MTETVIDAATEPLQPVSISLVTPDLDLASERPAQDGQFVVFRDWDGRIKTVPLTRDIVHIGRSLSAEIRFEDASVSRRHALIVRDDDGTIRVLDESSSNGTLVNGRPVTSHVLRDGDIVQIAGYQLHFADNTAALGRERVPEPAAA